MTSWVQRFLVLGFHFVQLSYQVSLVNWKAILMWSLLDVTDSVLFNCWHLNLLKFVCLEEKLKSAVLLGFYHLGSLGKMIKLVLVNSLMHYLPSTICFERNVPKKRKIYEPTSSSPSCRNYENAARMPSTWSIVTDWP